MGWALTQDLSRTDIPNTQFLVSRCCGQQRTVVVKRERCDQVGVLQGDLVLAGFQVPELDGVIQRGRCQHIFCNWMILYMSNLTCVTTQQLDRLDILDISVGIGEVLERIALWNLPQSNLSII
ncbi:unnamed protein product [Kuraishia capsulata CBS 1993]|uniref:Uncharacterized protein n=1 Tax=Kuraishia capsulata CBS 1993 TaxID=1382522 RepID=W6MQI8_9ASCO|nr:uncharacterized protein KUCA_T00000120001 [Kuraishia capsulata CBS 1993]CDK24160.1 unnamed protein product [Kuraishia capsulata CBS 1993]